MLQQRAYVGSGNAGFLCEQCGAEVPPVSNGSYRNHCPYCFYSKHLDVAPGDRSSACQGLMEPLAVVHHGRKGYQIIHRCTVCGEVRRNRIVTAGLAPDDAEQIRQLSAQPHIG